MTPSITRPGDAAPRASPVIQTHLRAPSSVPHVRASRPGPIRTDPSTQIPTSTIASSPSSHAVQNDLGGHAAFASAQELRSPSSPLVSPGPGRALRSPQPSASGYVASTETRQQPTQAPQEQPRAQLRSPSPVASSLSSDMALDRPPLPPSVLLLNHNQSNPSGSSVPSNPHKRQRIQVPMPSLKGRVTLINAHIESVGGVQYLNSSLERPRFQLLTEACNTEDKFYVALHQLFCVWDSPGGRTIIAKAQGLPDTPILSVSFRVLGQLIRDNEGLAPIHLKWFADFPSPLADLLRTSEAYHKIIMKAGEFLAKLASDWAPMSRLCSNRGYPPLVDELVYRMELLSPILQQIMFTATRRNLGIVDDQFGEQMEKLFRQDKQGHQELAARFNTARPPTEKEIVERSQGLIDNYLSIYDRALHSRRTLGPETGSPVANHPVLPAQASLQRTASVGGNDGSIASRQHNSNQAGNPSFPNPDHRLQNQQIQYGRVTSSSPPNPLVRAVAGRPPSAIGYRGYSNAPNPTLLQGLSMNSPVIQSPVLQQQQQPQQQGWRGPTPVLRNNSFPIQPTQITAGQPNFPNGNYNTMAHVSPHQQQFLAQQQLAIHLQQWPQQAQQVQQTQQVRQAEQVQQAQLFQQPQQAHHANQVQQGQQGRGAMQVQQQQPQYMTGRQVLQINRAPPPPRTNGHASSQSRNNNISTEVRPVGSANSHNLQLTRPNPPFIPQDQDAVIYSQKNALQRSLVPPLGFQHPAQPINPDLTALHQAHIRSPRLVPEDLSSIAPKDDPSRRFYQFVKDFAIGPLKIPVSSAPFLFEFPVPEASFVLISRDKVIGPDPLPVRAFKSGSLQYRIRCIKSKPESTKCLVPDWVMSDTVWPDTVFLEINSKDLEVRRKIHHGKDLPIDITQHVVPETAPGIVNRVKMAMPRLRKALKETSHFVAVEIIEILQHPQIMDMCQKVQRIPHSKTLEAIKKSLAPPTQDDDDFAMVVSDLSIDLADPFTARIFEIPVRGSSCLHRECFDLETFLLTRNSKPKRPNQPSMVDVWKCPLCGRDARPYSLRVDDFLASVRQELASQDRLDTKAILISADGSWRAKPEPRPVKRKATDEVEDENADAMSSDGEGTARKQQMVGRQNNPHLNNGVRSSKEVEIIELDDD